MLGGFDRFSTSPKLFFFNAFGHMSPIGQRQTMSVRVNTTQQICQKKHLVIPDHSPILVIPDHSPTSRTNLLRSEEFMLRTLFLKPAQGNPKGNTPNVGRLWAIKPEKTERMPAIFFNERCHISTVCPLTLGFPNPPKRTTNTSRRRGVFRR